MSMPLLQTKLYAPPPRPSLIPRPHLTGRVKLEALRALTLIAAPAGFGKTTLVSEWIGLVGAQKHSLSSPQCLPAVAWLSLDEDDNEPIRFLAYLIAALQTCQAQLGQTAMALIMTPQPPPPKTILTLLLNEVENIVTPLVLVLDDVHVITNQPIHEALIFLIDHLPPTLRLIMTSRVDPPLPLARWRVRNQLTEIRADDLRFLTHEATAFFNDVMGLQLTPSQIATLETRTEGWIAGLQLASLALQSSSLAQGRQDHTAFIEHFSGSHAYIIDYLAEEVLQHRPEAIQTFLLQTAILPRLCASLCDAVTGRSDGQAVLAQLQRLNLFLIALDDERHWFRYHHLFAEVLTNRLHVSQPALINLLHTRASDWFAAEGLLGEAIHHAMAAHDLGRIASIIEQHGISLLLQSQVALVNNWLKLLPQLMIEERAQLALVAAWIYMSSRQLDRLAYFLNEVPSLQTPDLGEEMQSQLLILRASLAVFRYNLPEAIFYARQALQVVPEHILSLRTTGLLILGSGLAQSNDWQAAEPILLEAIRCGRASGNLYNVMVAYHILSRFHSFQGNMVRAKAILQEALEVAAQQGQQPIPALGVIYIALGALLVEPEQFEQAERYLQRGEELTKACFQLEVLLYGWQTQAKLYAAHGNLEQAFAVLARAEAWLKQVTLPKDLRQELLRVLQQQHESLQAEGENERISEPQPLKQSLIEPLSDRELEILCLVHQGLSNSEIAEKLIVTVGTVKKHLNNIFGKLGAGSRTQALVRAREAKLL